jgi:hypothetical protein
MLARFYSKLAIENPGREQWQADFDSAAGHRQQMSASAADNSRICPLSPQNLVNVQMQID